MPEMQRPVSRQSSFPSLPPASQGSPPSLLAAAPLDTPLSPPDLVSHHYTPPGGRAATPSSTPPIDLSANRLVREDNKEEDDAGSGLVQLNEN
jgi:hypothetical protein